MDEKKSPVLSGKMTDTQQRKLSIFMALVSFCRFMLKNSN
uniref:Uncharacterized protein n=1 Tax=Colwellia sp. C1 TaxID=1737566 RepID=A0A161IZ64_9GAMM|nr:hypothetical protein [Colwellia sp. C1]